MCPGYEVITSSQTISFLWGWESHDHLQVEAASLEEAIAQVLSGETKLPEPLQIEDSLQLDTSGIILHNQLCARDCLYLNQITAPATRRTSIKPDELVLG